MILIINTGSSSIKYKLFDNDFSEVISGNFRVEGKNYSKSIADIIAQTHGYIDDIKIIGHRVVHGGNDADEIMPVSLNTMKIIKKYSPLGFIINQNNGERAGQTIAHYHLHIKPVYEGTVIPDEMNHRRELSKEEMNGVLKDLIEEEI